MKKLDKLAKLLEGIGSVLCLYPRENRRKITLPNSSVSDALKEDWEKVGLDIWKAYRIVESRRLEAKQYKDRNDRFEKSPRQYP